jgi:hypothetical protein
LSACQRDAGSINPKEVRVNKRDSPRISKEIHIDRKQPLGVSLKGSSEQVLATCGLDENPEWAQARVPCQKTKSFVPNRPKMGPGFGSDLGKPDQTSFEELQAYGLGYLKSAAQAECYRVFDKMVERASREMKRGLWPE